MSRPLECFNVHRLTLSRHHPNVNDADYSLLSVGAPMALTSRANAWSQAFPELFEQSLAKVLLTVVPLDIVNTRIGGLTQSDRIHNPTGNRV